MSTFESTLTIINRRARWVDSTSCDFYIAGVATRGDSCVYPDHTSLMTFTNVEEYSEWIEYKTGITTTTGEMIFCICCMF